MGEACGMQGVTEKYIVGVVQEADGIEAIGILRHRWKNDIKMFLEGIGLLECGLDASGLG
jgi:hypothetical protein